jgi:Holliday junction resolvasome RuvABC endonuclease subunit
MYEPAVLDPAAAGASVVGLDLSLTGTGIAAIAVDTAELHTAVHTSPPPAIDTVAGHAARHRQLVDGIVRQVLGADPVLVVVEGMQFSIKARDSSLARRGFCWWSVVEQLCAAGAPVMEVTPQQIKQFATGRGSASKAEVVAAYAKAWPDAPMGRNIEDRADAAHAAALGAAWIGVTGLPQGITAVRAKLLAKLPEPTLPPRAERSAGAA